MRRSPWERLLYALSLACASVPFVFALIRALHTGSDTRFVWTAFASFLSASGVVAIAQGRGRSSALGPVTFLGGFVVAVLAAGATAFMLGATSGPAVWIVALAFAFCWAAYYGLHALSRPRPR